MATTSTNENETVAKKTEDTEEKTLTLKSSDGQEFEIPLSSAVLSETIKNMVEDGCELTSIPIAIVDGATLSKIISYLNKHAEFEKLGVEASKKREFDDEFVNVETNVLFNLVLSANYLNVKSLLDLACAKVANLMKDKSPEWVRKTFGIENDYTPEEEANVRQQYEWAFEGIKDD